MQISRPGTLVIMLACVPVLLGVAQRALAVPPAVIYSIDVTIRPETQTLRATASLEITSPPATGEPLILYLHDGLRVRGALLGGAPMVFSQETVPYLYNYTMRANKITIDTTGADLTDGISLTYEGRFEPSSERAPSDYMRIDSSGAYLRSFGYSLWIPTVLEDRSTPHVISIDRLTVRTPPAFSAACVGDRIASSLTDSERISEWRAPSVLISDVQCTVHRFATVHIGNTSLYARHDPASIDAVADIAGLVSQLQELMERHYRVDASTSQLHIVQMPEFGDVSSANMVGLSDERWRSFGNEPHSARVLAHELVHPYVHAQIEENDPLTALMMEGAPSYFHLPLLASINGESGYDEFMDLIQTGYLSRRQRAHDGDQTLPPEIPITEITRDAIGLYKDRFVLSDRALLFFDHLRRIMGPEQFLRFTRAMLHQEPMSLSDLYATIDDFAPDTGARDNARVWLETTEFPPALHRQRVAPDSGTQP